MQIRGRKPKKQPIRAGGISASPPQATRGCAARCRGFAAFACARETQQYRQLRRLKNYRFTLFSIVSSVPVLSLQTETMFSLRHSESIQLLFLKVLFGLLPWISNDVIRSNALNTLILHREATSLLRKLLFKNWSVNFLLNLVISSLTCIELPL